MEINDFSALIQLTATLTMAFVAVEYVKSYTRVVCNRFFRLEYNVEEAFTECLGSLTDEETLKNMPAPIIEGKSTNIIIQQTKIKNETLRKKIAGMQDDKKGKIDTVCRARSMSSLCFFLFMTNTLLLFLAGLEGCYGIYSHIACIMLCACSIVYIVLGWCLGERTKPLRFLNFTSLRHPIYCVVILTVLSALVLLLANRFIGTQIVQGVENYWWYILALFMTVSYVNFMVFVCKIWYKARRFLKDIYALKDITKQECEDAQSDIKKLLAASQLNEKLSADEGIPEDDYDIPLPF